MPSFHSLSAVENELMALGSALGDMARLTRAQLDHLLEAIRDRNPEGLKAVVAEDQGVDAGHGRVETLLLGLLARIQPMARDLRSVLSAQRVALELERSGDHSKRVAKHLLKIGEPLPDGIVQRLLWFGDKARALQELAVEAYLNADAEAAQRAWGEDADLDRVHHEFISDLISRMRGDGEWVQIGVTLVGVTKSLERIGDHATNIAEEARFVAMGEILQSHRRVNPA